MANIKDVKAPLDREFRNTINENFRAMNGDVSASKAQMDEALSEAKAANKTAGDALTTAGEAERVANNVQEQFNGVVLEGSIDPETAQARVDYNGKEYETLKARIDANQVEVMSTQSSVQSLSLNALDFKEEGDTDAAAINKAIEYASQNGLGNVHISKDVTLDAPIYAKSNIRITSDPAAKIEVNGGYGIVVEGSIGEEIPIAANLTMGSTVIETTVEHGLKVGDLVRIKSQRDALSVDAGDNWRLGYATASVPGCYFGEFVRVKTVTSATSFEITAGLLFPDYRTDSANETASTARATTTIQKVTPIENVIIDGLNFTGKQAVLLPLSTLITVTHEIIQPIALRTDILLYSKILSPVATVEAGFTTTPQLHRPKYIREMLLKSYRLRLADSSDRMQRTVHSRLTSRIQPAKLLR